MEITRQVREYAREQGVGGGAAIETGMREKSAEFRKKGSKLYV